MKAVFKCALGVMLGASAPLVAQSSSPASYAAAIRAHYNPLTTVMARDARLPERLARRVSVHIKRAPLPQVLVEIATQARLGLSYGEEVASANATVSLDLDHATAAEALVAAVRGTGWIAMVTAAGQVLVVEAPPKTAKVQTGSIVGTVIDAKTGEPVPAVTVTVEGTALTAHTDADGKYRIAGVPAGTYTMSARRLGYAKATREVTVSDTGVLKIDIALEKSAGALDQVVVTGTIIPTEVKALPTPVTIVTADEIERQHLQRVDQIFRGQVPGAIAWDLGPQQDFSTMAVRGTSTLASNSSIKTFVDGIELANPIYAAMIDPNTIERIEVIRGPQASTLYGAGALDGVMQIFTKKGELGLTRPVVTGKVSVGSIGGLEGQSAALVTNNAISIRGGGKQTSYNLGASYQHEGEWVASYRSSDWGVSAGTKTIQGPFTLTSSLRYADHSYDAPWDTRLREYAPDSKPLYWTLRTRQQTYGLTASAQATPGWQHTLTLGYDQEYFVNTQTQPRFITPDDSLLEAAVQSTAKTSLLYHTDLNVQLGPVITAALTAGINYEAYDYSFSSARETMQTSGLIGGPITFQRIPWTNTGYFGQAQVNIAEQLFLTAGIRAERNPNFGADIGTAWSPRVGVAYAQELGPATVKLRASYGEGIRAPTPGQRRPAQTPTSQYLANPDLAPERQRGVDAGADLSWGRASFGVTYYSQQAIDLIQRVTIPTPPGTLHTYQYQNVSRVQNDGWELEGRVPLGPIRLTGTYSITSSRIKALPSDYPAGDYEVNDRLRAIPRSSGGATITYSPTSRTTLTAGVTYIGHWVSYDYIALAAYFNGVDPYRGSLRAYWMEYPTVTELTLGVSQVLANGVTAFVQARNVGNNIGSEQGNNRLAKPRSIIVGASFRY